MAEEWVKNARGEIRVALDARAEMEVEQGALKENHAKMAEQLKETVRARNSAEVGSRRWRDNLKKCARTCTILK